MRAPNDYTIIDEDTWELAADFTADSAGKPLGVRLEHMANVADTVRVIVDPIHGDFPTAPTTEDGAPLASGTTKEWAERIAGSGEGAIGRVWIKSAGLATVNVEPSIS
jgi:hypothetical protein